MQPPPPGFIFQDERSHPYGSTPNQPLGGSISPYGTATNQPRGGSISPEPPPSYAAVVPFAACNSSSPPKGVTPYTPEVGSYPGASYPGVYNTQGCTSQLQQVG